MGRLDLPGEFHRCSGGCALAVTIVICGVNVADSPLNILIILTDDRGFGDVSIHGTEWIKTPNMDCLASAECPLKIASSGKYRVTFRYACPPDAVGSRFRLRGGGAVLEFTIAEPWISAVYPASEQVSRRNGGYLSRTEWKDVVVGEIELEKDDTLLKLEALERSGATMPDFKAVMFEKL